VLPWTPHRQRRQVSTWPLASVTCVARSESLRAAATGAFFAPFIRLGRNRDSPLAGTSFLDRLITLSITGSPDV
jgi:hypothetical protein